jgi:two-component system NtrC family sensor kinase
MAVNLTLRTKGVIAILILIGYLALIAVFLGSQRQDMISIVQEMENNQTALGHVEPIVNALAHSLVDSQAILNSQDGFESRAISFGDLSQQLEELNLAMEEVRTVFPALEEDVTRFRRAAGAVKAVPAAHHLAQMRDSEQVLLVKLQDVLRASQKQSAGLTQQYQEKQQFVSVFAVSANVVGAVASVAVILIFFTKLAGDINRLQERASAIVAGYDGEPLRIVRRDEVGGLFKAVNRMQVDLRQWEQQLEVTRQQRFHQEKMAAVGSLASAIGHEVSNPIAAISGVAQFIVDESADDERPQGRQIHQFAGQILVQTERIAHIMRQMATLTAPRSPLPELLNLNALIRSTCGFIRYDKRFRNVQFEEVLDQDLPAITAVADHITQILMNLLINAADAFDRVSDASARKIRVATRAAGDEVHLAVTDNGCGMTPEVLAKAFNESFTTKPVGQGRGIGLFVCKSLIEKSGGRIELSSTPGEGTTATIFIPLRPPDHPAS